MKIELEIIVVIFVFSYDSLVGIVRVVPGVDGNMLDKIILFSICFRRINTSVVLALHHFG